VETNEKKGTFLLNVREEEEVCISKLVSGLLFFDKFKPNLCTSSIWTIFQFIFRTNSVSLRGKTTKHKNKGLHLYVWVEGKI
jgi:hypothetical protein